MKAACSRKGLATRVVRLDRNSNGETDRDDLTCSAHLRSSDCLRALMGWLKESAEGLRWCFGGDAKRRSLFVASISGIREHHRLRVFAQRLVADYGPPVGLVSIAPWAPESVTVVEQLRKRGISTVGIRTQSTWLEPEHVAINTDVLFCKSVSERRVYEAVLPSDGPRLRDGCLLSLPEAYNLPPLPLPAKYALLVEANLPDGQHSRNQQLFNARLHDVAESAGLRPVYKEHYSVDPSRRRPEDGGRLDTENQIRVSDIRRNRELIDRAQLVISPPSTLLYYAILQSVPIVIVEAWPSTSLADEFRNAPIQRIAWEEGITPDLLDWQAIRASTHAVLAWFKQNYFLDNGADFLIDFMLASAQDQEIAGHPPASARGDVSEVRC